MKSLSVKGFVFSVLDGRVLACEHPEVVMTRRTIKGGSQQAVRQCTRCFKTVSNPVSKASVQNFCELPEFQNRVNEYYAAHSEATQLLMQDDRKEWFRQHTEYLRSPEWMKKRKMVLARARGLCEGCMENQATQVHHLTYKHWRDELLFELVAVCNECHEKSHEQDKGTGNG